MHPYTVHTHNILYTSYILIWFFGYLGYWGKHTPQIKSKQQNKNQLPQKFPQNFSLNENDYHLQSN